MFSALRSRYGIPGLIATVALVFAMTGGAFAAKYLITSTKQIKPSVLKALKGKAGPAGSPGVAGAQGPAGAAGAAGPQGEKGATGANGTNGKSVAVADYAGVECGTATEEGVSVEVEGTPASKKYVCDGEEGVQGPQGPQGIQGNPWTPNSQLPVGATETGFWTNPIPDKTFTAVQSVVISFPIQLAADLDDAHTHYEDDANFTDFDGGGPGTVGCAGSAASPTAPSGHLCIYKTLVFEVTLVSTIEAVSRAGGSFTVKNNGGGIFGNLANGTWAVTG